MYKRQVIDYVVEKYGADRVAQIITFGTMAARAVIRDVGRALNMPYAEVDVVAKMIPFELKMTIDKALKANPQLQAELSLIHICCAGCSLWPMRQRAAA